MHLHMDGLDGRSLDGDGDLVLGPSPLDDDDAAGGGGEEAGEGGGEERAPFRLLAADAHPEAKSPAGTSWQSLSTISHLSWKWRESERVGLKVAELRSEALVEDDLLLGGNFAFQQALLTETIS